MSNDELEILVCAYIDGTIAPENRAAVEAHLNADDQARQMLREYRKVDDALRSMPLPSVQWDRFAEHLSATIARQELPAQSYRISWAQTGRMAALAASLLLAVGLTLHLLSARSSTPKEIAATPAHNLNISVAEVTGPSIDSTAGPASAEVTIGPPPSSAAMDIVPEGVVVEPSHVDIASAADDQQNMPH